MGGGGVVVAVVTIYLYVETVTFHSTLPTVNWRPVELTSCLAFLRAGSSPYRGASSVDVSLLYIYEPLLTSILMVGGVGRGTG